MGRKKKNNLKRIEKNSNFNSKRQRHQHTNKILGEEIIFILETESPELSDEELEIIQSMPGVYFRPRTRKQTIISDGTQRRWQLLGFSSYHHFLGFNAFNNCVGGVSEVDLMAHLEDTLASNKRSN
ncbi:TPA: hypothetical protein J1442_000895 [Escherichia coli]|uniref:hypothetical protein n=1 Tax=Escherichia coli TaxID=562 RepID=UPI0007A0C182|nr:hypothetical protein [Escherichia coli]ECC3538765.1 hypothetical protein [Salmonella enterica subsp. enterica serovar Aberdeen]EEC0821820.1 hypothetical protein [Salmonella enterica subsp. enterica serovar Aberdeen]EEQ3929381.1 hypothetical protein [Escherichia coli]EEQ9665630.1 hypothetical protein [Escherichia coli]EEV7639468.1 hypothetical protein [Escherichia coli]